MRQEVTDEFLYQYMPQAEEAWIGAIEKQAEEGHVYSRRFEKKMKRILKDGSRSSTMRRVMRMGRRAAAVLLILLTAAFTICISVEATREQLIDFVEEIHEDWTEYRYNLKEGVEREFRHVEPEYLPEGYYEDSREKVGDMTFIYYRNESREVDTEIEYMECLADGLTVGLDTEGIKVKTKKIKGEKIHYFENKGVGYVFWTDEDTYYDLTAYIEVEELLKMAESIIEKEN